MCRLLIKMHKSEAQLTQRERGKEREREKVKDGERRKEKGRQRVRGRQRERESWRERVGERERWRESENTCKGRTHVKVEKRRQQFSRLVSSPHASA
jgi:hypothetical protein